MKSCYLPQQARNDRCKIYRNMLEVGKLLDPEPLLSKRKRKMVKVSKGGGKLGGNRKKKEMQLHHRAKSCAVGSDGVAGAVGQTESRDDICCQLCSSATCNTPARLVSHLYKPLAWKGSGKFFRYKFWLESKERSS